MGDCTGTFVNKRALAPKTFEQVRPGYVLKFGESQRIYLLTGPEYQRPPELESETLAKVRQALKEKETRREARKQALELARQGSGDAAAVAAAIAARVSVIAPVYFYSMTALFILFWTISKYTFLNIRPWNSR